MKSRYFEPPPPYFWHTVTKVSTPFDPQSVTSFLKDPLNAHLVWSRFVRQQYCRCRNIVSSLLPSVIGLKHLKPLFKRSFITHTSFCLYPPQGWGLYCCLCYWITTNNVPCKLYPFSWHTYLVTDPLRGTNTGHWENVAIEFSMSLFVCPSVCLSNA